MKRYKLIELVAKKMKTSRVEAQRAIETIEHIMLDTLKSSNEETVVFAGAKFGTKLVKGRKGIINGTTWETQDSYQGCVKPMTKLKELKHIPDSEF